MVKHRFKKKKKKDKRPTYHEAAAGRAIDLPTVPFGGEPLVIFPEFCLIDTSKSEQKLIPRFHHKQKSATNMCFLICSTHLPLTFDYICSKVATQENRETDA